MTCYGNKSIDDILRGDYLDLDNLKKINLTLDSIKNNNCKIPGYNIQIPSVNIPQIDIDLPIELPQYLCLLPNIPSFPSIRLPGFKLPKIPIPFLPAIPIPFPNIFVSIPKIPKLPALSLPMITFLCPFIQINTPTLNIFKDINNYINKYNNKVDFLLNLLNNTNNICQLVNMIKSRSETINGVEYVNNINDIVKDINKIVITEKNNMKIKDIVNKYTHPNIKKPTQNSKYYKVKNKIDQNKIKNLLRSENITNIEDKQDIVNKLVFILVNNDIIPIEINILKLIFNYISENIDLYINNENYFIDDISKFIELNNIPTVNDYKFLTLSDLDNIIQNISDDKNIFKVYETDSIYNTFYSDDFKNKILTKGQLLKQLINIGFLVNNEDIENLYNLLPENVLDLNPFDLLSIINSAAIKYNYNVKDSISEEDIIFSYYLYPINNFEDIINPLVLSGVIYNTSDNIKKAKDLIKNNLKTFTPREMAKILNNVIVGDTIGSFRAKYNYLFNRDNVYINKQLDLINKVNISKLKLSKSDFLSKISFFEDNILFPFTINDISDILSYIFDIDIGYFNNNIEKFNNFDDLYDYLINNIFKSNYYNFNNYLKEIKYTLESNGVKEIKDYKKICSILSSKYNYDYIKMYNIIKDIKISTFEELSFIILMFGFFKKEVDTENIFSIIIHSPSGNINDIIDDSINVSIVTINKDEIFIIKNGNANMANIYKIKDVNINEYKIDIINIHRIDNSIIEKIIVDVNYNKNGEILKVDEYNISVLNL